MFATLTGVIMTGAMVIGATLTAIVALIAGFIAARRVALLLLQSGVDLPPVVRTACLSLSRAFSREIDEAISSLEPLTYVLALIAAILVPWLGIFAFCAVFTTTLVLALTGAAIDRYCPDTAPHIKSAVFELVARICVVSTAYATNEMTGRPRHQRYDLRRRVILSPFTPR